MHSIGEIIRMNDEAMRGLWKQSPIVARIAERHAAAVDAARWRDTEARRATERRMRLNGRTARNG